jgi:hypothetical protein
VSKKRFEIVLICVDYLTMSDCDALTKMNRQGNAKLLASFLSVYPKDGLKDIKLLNLSLAGCVCEDTITGPLA